MEKVSPTFAVEDEMGLVTTTVIAVPPGTIIFCPAGRGGVVARLAGVIERVKTRASPAVVKRLNTAKTSEAQSIGPAPILHRRRADRQSGRYVFEVEEPVGRSLARMQRLGFECSHRQKWVVLAQL